MDTFPFYTLTNDELYVETYMEWMRIEDYKEIIIGDTKYIAFNNQWYPSEFVSNNEYEYKIETLDLT